MNWLKDKILWLYWNTRINTNWVDFYFGGMFISLTSLIAFLAVSSTFSYISIAAFIICLIFFIKNRQ